RSEPPAHHLLARLANYRDCGMLMDGLSAVARLIGRPWRSRNDELDRSATAVSGNSQRGSLLPSGFGIRSAVGTHRAGSSLRGRHVRGLDGVVDRARRAGFDPHYTG